MGNDKKRKISKNKICSASECKVCGRETVALENFDQYYMVKDVLWREHGVAGMLCIACLQARMGRALRWSDFLPCPLSVMHLTVHGHRYQNDLAQKGYEDDLAQFLAAAEKCSDYFQQGLPQDEAVS